MIITGTSRKIKARQSLYGKRKSLKQFVIITPENPMGVKASAVDNANFRQTVAYLKAYIFGIILLQLVKKLPV